MSTASTGYPTGTPAPRAGAAAARFRRPDGSYRFENRLKYRILQA